MKTIRKNPDDLEELLHPFWLGLIMLFTVTVVVGTICLLRKKCGKHISYLFNQLRCKNPLNIDHSKANRHISKMNAYNWAPVYAPPSSLSPKLYRLVKNIQMAANIDKPSSPSYTEKTEDSIENDVFSIPDESEQIKTTIIQINNLRNSEAARKFYANMRYTSDTKNSSSIDSSNTEGSVLQTNRLIKLNPLNKLKSFRTPHFFKQ